MAIVARMLIEAAGSDQYHRLQQAVETQLAARGGPPDGLMVHVGYPGDDGVFVVEAWRTEEQFRSFIAEVLQPALEVSGLTATEAAVADAWSIAIP